MLLWLESSLKLSSNFTELASGTITITMYSLPYEKVRWVYLECRAAKAEYQTVLGQDLLKLRE